jgi:hypothetical protein
MLIVFGYVMIVSDRQKVLQMASAADVSPNTLRADEADIS